MPPFAMSPQPNQSCELLPADITLTRDCNRRSCHILTVSLIAAFCQEGLLDRASRLTRKGEINCAELN